MLSWSRSAFNDCVVLDDGSTDKTVDIAKQFQCRVFPRKSDPNAFGANIRLELEEHAAYDWCFHADADELIDANMLEKVTHWIKPNSPDRKENVVAFKFPRYNPNLWPNDKDYQIRLVDRRYVGWRRAVHPEPILKRSQRPIDEWETVGGRTVKYCQTLDMHPLIHLQYFRSKELREATRQRWARLEALTGVKPPTETVL